MNRSVPTNTMLAHVVYQDVAGAIEWLTSTFGFIEHYRYGEPAQGAQMYLGDAWIMLKSARDGWASPAQLGAQSQSVTIFVEDVDALRARIPDAQIVEEVNETPYGERQFVARDPEGHHWLFARHVRDVAPEEWGAKLAG